MGAAICERGELPEIPSVGLLGAIVSAAALAHDLGNPPFGHSGEDAIRVWFETSKVGQDARTQLRKNEQEDIARFEGNAQGFRLITRLQMPDNPGLRLTCATLGAFTKYPIEALVPDKARVHEGASTKKFGFFQNEREFFAEVARAVLRAGTPLAAARLVGAASARLPRGSGGRYLLPPGRFRRRLPSRLSRVR